MLSNFQLGNQALLQTFLVGQPELRRMLHSATMEQLRQRVIASCHLGPLSADETRGYVEYRLRKVGWVDRPKVGEAAFAAIHQRSGGIPRRINVLCTRALLAGWLAESDEITPESVAEAAAELGAELAGGDAQDPTNRAP